MSDFAWGILLGASCLAAGFYAGAFLGSFMANVYDRWRWGRIMRKKRTNAIKAESGELRAKAWADWSRGKRSTNSYGNGVEG